MAVFTPGVDAGIRKIPGVGTLFGEALKSKTTLEYTAAGLGGDVFGLIEFDVVTPRTDTFTNTITDNAVEDGSLITDHIVIMPREVTFDFLITESPVEFSNPIKTGIATAGQFVNSIATPGGDDRSTRAQTIVDKLRELRETRANCTLTGRYYVIEDMYLESLSLTVNAEGGDSVSGSITLKQLQFVQTQTVGIAKRDLASAVQPTAAPETKAAVQKTQAAKGATKKAADKAADKVTGGAAGDKKSLLKGVTDGVKKLFSGG